MYRSSTCLPIVSMRPTSAGCCALSGIPRQLYESRIAAAHVAYQARVSTKGDPPSSPYCPFAFTALDMAGDFHRDVRTQARGGRKIDTGGTRSPRAGLGRALERFWGILLFSANGRHHCRERMS